MNERSEIHCLRRLDLRYEIMEMFGGKVRTVWPSKCMPFQDKLLEVFDVLQWLKNRPIEFIRKIDLPICSITEF